MLRATDQWIERQATRGWRGLFGTRKHPEVKRLISENDQHTYIMLRIYEGGAKGTEIYLRQHLAPHIRDLGKRFFDNDQTVYTNISNVELFPFLKELRDVLREEFYLPVLPSKKIPMDALQLNRGLASLHKDLIKDINRPDPLDLTLLDGVDPYFEIKVNKRKQTNLRSDLTLGMNTYKLRKMITDSPEVKQNMTDRYYPTIHEGELVTIGYILKGIPGREKEISPIDYSSL